MRYLILSLVLHSLLLISITPVVKPEKQETELQFLEQPPETGRNNGSYKIKELSEGQGEKPENFYWGLGMNTEDYFDIDKGSYVHKVKQIYSGYNAEKYGLQINDLITLINDEPITGDNQIKGDEFKKLKLTIYRNGAIIIIQAERGKVYY